MRAGTVEAPPTDWLPDGAAIVALVRESGAGEWAAGMAIGLADIVGRRRGKTFLANLDVNGSELDRSLGTEGGPGLSTALTGGASIASVARSAPQRCFAYLPAGESALSLSALGRVPAFRRLVEKMGAGGGTLLLYVAEEDLEEIAGNRATEDLRLDGCIALGRIQEAALLLGAPLLARIERPEAASSPPAAGQPAGQATVETTEASSRPVSVLLPALILLTAVVGWLVLGPATDSEPAAGVAAEAEEAGPGEGGATDARDLSSWTAPPAAYSVLVGSYVRLEDAEERREALSGNGDLFYVSPTPVRGRTYYRVFAGVHEDRVDAISAMRRLVAEGRKETVKMWDVRPVRLAHDAGTFENMDRAEETATSLREVDIPSYVLMDTSAVPRYRVYAGAFESEEAADALGRSLGAHGFTSELGTRSGIAP